MLLLRARGALSLRVVVLMTVGEDTLLGDGVLVNDGLRRVSRCTHVWLVAVAVSDRGASRVRLLSVGVAVSTVARGVGSRLLVRLVREALGGNSRGGRASNEQRESGAGANSSFHL